MLFLFRHSMVIVQQLLPIYNTTVNKNKSTDTKNISKDINGSANQKTNSVVTSGI